MNGSVKKTCAFVLILILAAPLCCRAAGKEAVKDNMWTKFGRGVQNVVFGPAEVFYQPIRMHEEGHSWPVALPGGILRGIPYAVARVGVGLYEVVTFPFPGGTNYGPIMKPESIVATGFKTY